MKVSELASMLAALDQDAEVFVTTEPLREGETIPEATGGFDRSELIPTDLTTRVVEGVVFVVGAPPSQSRRSAEQA